MNTTMLFIGAAVMLVTGTVLDYESFSAVGLGLFYMGLATP